MKPVDFAEATHQFERPASMTAEECSVLPVWTDGKDHISCWKPSWKERLSILFFGNVWLDVYGYQPPVVIWAERQPFHLVEGEDE